MVVIRENLYKILVAEITQRSLSSAAAAAAAAA